MGLVSMKSQRIIEQADKNPCDVLTAQSGNRKYSDAWLLDSECPYHMCPKKEWFSTYKSYDRGSILKGNDVVCKIVDISNIHMGMFYGHVRTLLNVRHVPNLRENILSLEALKA